MNWLLEFQGLESPNLMETEVDCLRCQVAHPLKRDKAFKPQAKCCDFSPFVSCFALGSLISGGKSLEKLLMGKGELVVTRLGVVHSVEHRSEKKVCQFFKAGLCEIWQERPATCYSFSCASRDPHKLQVWEEKLMSWEANLLRQWFETLDLDETIWRDWGESMELIPHESIPEELLLSNLKEAGELFKKSHQWLYSL